MRICIKCNVSKDLTEYRGNRKKCNPCDNKRRYGQKKSRIITDEVYREKVMEWDREKMKRKRSETGTLFYYKEMCRNVCRNSFKRKGFKKTSKTGELLGCDWLTFKTHIESKWLDGMTWENHSLKGWHIDHIIPIDFGKTPEEVAQLCHYRNLQPLWAEDNWEKSNKILKNGKTTLKVK